MDHIPPVTLRTSRLLIRPFTAEDAPDIVVACDNDDAARFLATPSPYTIEDAHAFLANAERKWAAGSAEWAIVDESGDRHLGGIGLANVDRRRGVAEIGYLVAPHARGSGIGAEATIAVTNFLFEQGFERVELSVAAPNIASQRTALKAGFTVDAMLRSATVIDGNRHDQLIFARLRTDHRPPSSRFLPDLPDGHLTDGVVSLTPLTVDDIDAHFAHSSLPEVWGTSMPPLQPNRASSEAQCTYGAHSAWLTGNAARMAIRESATGAFAGCMGVYRQGGLISQVMIGYSLSRDFRGRGFMTRAVQLTINWAFDVCQVERITAGTATTNHASQAVLRRVGFTRDGVERARLIAPNGEYQDSVMWSFLRGDRS